MCTPCLPGRFCDQPGLIEPNGVCSAGYYCPVGSSSATPLNFSCLEGGYCPEGVAYPIACPPGTYNPAISSKRLLDCLSCPPGMYCDGERNEQPDGYCKAGFFCTEGSSTPVPFESSSGDICPMGHFCPEGSHVPLPCAPGSFAARVGQEQCTPCPAGYVCAGYQQVSPRSCPVAHYCTANSSTPVPCPAGSYSNRTELTSESECSLCPPG
ncbi:hypothetical protein GUITHDRAFT_72334, partial [Guillardia theta CCMP2712]